MTFVSALTSKDRKIEGHRRWPRVVVDAGTWRLAVVGIAAGEGTLLDLWSDGEAVHPAVHLLAQRLKRTYAATPDPRWVIEVGHCARDGRIFAGSCACVGGVSTVVPDDLHIRGCPANPTTLLQGSIGFLEGATART